MIKRFEPGEVIAILRRVFRENGRQYLRQYLLAAACLVLIAATTAFTAWIIRDVVDEIFFRQRHDLVPVISGSILAAFLIRGFATYGQAVLLAKVGNNLVARYQQRIFDHLMRLGLDFHSANRSGELAARINQNITGIRDLLNLTVASIARDALAMIGLVGVMILQDPLLSLITLIIGPPLIYAVNAISRRLRRVTRDSIEVNSRLLGAMQETVQGIAIVKAFTMEGQLSERLGRLIAEAERQANKIARVQERTGPIAETLAGVAIAGVIAYSSYRAVHANVPPGSVFSFITALLLAYEPAKRLARAQITLERALVNARMIYEILDTEAPQRDAVNAPSLRVASGRIEFDNVRFGYAPGQPVIDGLSFVVPAGTTTAIVGPSGAGKSTVIALIQRFHDPQAGRILIDGTDIRTVTKQSLRRSIAYVSQTPFLFEGSIADNIRYGRPDATLEEIREAARLACCEEFIERLPRGYDTPVDESGANLSGGQRQRISIARALVRNAPILLLDEATSALDNESEKKLQRALQQVMEGRTTIVIAHRLSTVVRADNIIVMDRGRVVEEGTHAQLRDRAEGIYARYYRLGAGAGFDLVDDDAAGPEEGAMERDAVTGARNE